MGKKRKLVMPPRGEIKAELARRLCLRGNPLPMVALQWPELLVTDPTEAAFFDGEIGSFEDPCLRIDFWQRDILKSFFDESIREVFIKGCTGAGKGMISSIILNLAFEVWREAKIVLTSASYDHAVQTLFAEVVKWRLKMKCPGPGNILSDALYHNKQHNMTVKNPQTGEGFSGKHGEMVIFAFDEASGARELLYFNALNQFHKLLALSNPRTLHGWFRDGFKSCTDPDVTQTVDAPFGRRRCVSVSGLDLTNVRYGRLKVPFAPFDGIEIKGQTFGHNQRIPPEFFDQVRVLIPEQTDLTEFRGTLQHPDKREVAVKAYGKFPSEDPLKQVILPSWCSRHIKAWRQDLKVEAFGLDVARSLDGDKTVLAVGGKDGCLVTYDWQFADNMIHVQKVLDLARERHGIDLKKGQHPVAIDYGGGYGAGVGDVLRRLGVWVIEFEPGAGSEVDKQKYGNMRAESYGTLGRRLDPSDQWKDEPWALPDDPELIQELCAPEKLYQGNDGFRFYLMPKTGSPDSGVVSVKSKLGGRSPDKGDAVVILFFAVRRLHVMNGMFQLNRPLMCWPPLPGEAAKDKPPGSGEQEVVGMAWKGKTQEEYAKEQHVKPTLAEILGIVGGTNDYEEDFIEDPERGRWA